MLCHSIELMYSIVCRPFITVDNCPKTNMLPNEWEKCAGIPLRDNLHVPKCWSMADIHYGGHPNLTFWRAPAVVLKDEVYLVTIIVIVYSSYTLGLCRNSDSSIWTITPEPPCIRGAPWLRSRQLPMFRKYWYASTSVASVTTFASWGGLALPLLEWELPFFDFLQTCWLPAWTICHLWYITCICYCTICWLYMLFCIPVLVLGVTAHLNHHRGSAGWAAGLHRQQILPSEPGYLIINVAENNWTNIQDAHLLKFVAFVFAVLACDWVSFCPTFLSCDHSHLMRHLRMGSRICSTVGPSIQVDPNHLW